MYITGTSTGATCTNIRHLKIAASVPLAIQNHDIHSSSGNALRWIFFSYMVFAFSTIRK